MYDWSKKSAGSVAPVTAAPADTTAALSLAHPWFQATAKALRAWDADNAGKPPGAPQPERQALLLPPPDIATVATVAQLQAAALDEAAMDIAIVNHLDLRGAASDNLGYVLPLSSNTRSIRVRRAPPVATLPLRCPL
jgi:hypothetical protein